MFFSLCFCFWLLEMFEIVTSHVSAEHIDEVTLSLHITLHFLPATPSLSALQLHWPFSSALDLDWLFMC